MSVEFDVPKGKVNVEWGRMEWSAIQGTLTRAGRAVGAGKMKGKHLTGIFSGCYCAPLLHEENEYGEK